jgi:signal transduction histidine kinase
MQYAIAAMLNANSLQQLSKSDRLQASETDKASLDSAVETIVTNTTFIKNFSSFYLSSVMPSRRKQKAVKVSAVIERTLAAMAPILNRQNIDCTREYSGLEDSKVFAFEIDLESIFVNLLTNAVEALSMTKKGHKKIHIRFSSARDKLVLKFLDSGKGIPKTHSAAIFDPMFSTRTDRKGNQIGTGMGLSILKTIVEEHIKGSIAVIGKGQMGGAEFELTFPVRTAKGK